MQISSDLATNQISLLNSHPNPAHRKYERFACTIRIGLKYLSTSIAVTDRYVMTNAGLCEFIVNPTRKYKYMMLWHYDAVTL